jgi:hypothetical protein
MNLRALLVIGCLGLSTFAPADAKPRSNNPNVKRAMKKAKKVKPHKYKAPKAKRTRSARFV